VLVVVVVGATTEVASEVDTELVGVVELAELAIDVEDELVLVDSTAEVVVELVGKAADPVIEPLLVGLTTVVVVVSAALAVTGLTTNAAPSALVPTKTTNAVHHCLPALYSR